MNFVDPRRKITEKLPKNINSRIFLGYLNEKSPSKRDR